jgi:hypothetical protein
MAATATTPVSTTEALSLWRPGLVAAIVAAGTTTAIAAVTMAAGVTFETAPGEAIPIIGFAQLTFVFSSIGILIAWAIRRRAARPRQTFTTVAVVLTVLSVVPDITMPFATASKLTLILSHLVAAAIVVPVLARRLPLYAGR